MATTSIWSIKNNLKQSLNYIINSEKTINKDYGKESYNYLEISTTEYNFKNEKVCYVSSLNCSEDNPYEDMKFTKERFGKTDGILAFHGYQSFKKGEVTAAVAHEIGVKFAEEMFKDYEVVVSTHQNTNHIHNHFILNSVSFKTGKKYNNNRTNIAKLRQISDSLCAEYGLSVLDEDIGYKSTYNHKVLDNDYYKTLKEDLDNVISYSITLKQVIERLKKLDYQVYSRNGIITIYRNGRDKVRIQKAFGDDYSIDNINKRLYLSRQIIFKPIPQKTIFEEYSKTNYEEYRNLMGKRENLWKRYHRAKTEEDKSKILTEINDIQPKIKELRKYDKYCKDIFERSESIQNNLNNFDKDMQKEKDNIRAL